MSVERCPGSGQPTHYPALCAVCNETVERVGDVGRRGHERPFVAADHDRMVTPMSDRPWMRGEVRYPDGLRQDPDPDATEPTGMCGWPKKCSACPSTFLCFMKARAENERITR